ncbi:hypothetical protein AB0L04_22600 [Streptomyces glaucescens]|uniref:hypothetical protein n=1 Tax=Streptomyces glaucescens TaxID=1907 RepID=UPI00344C873B
MSALQSTPAAGDTSDCLARPVRFKDPARNAAYWERIRRIVDAAPPLTDEQRAVIRTAFSQPRPREAA